MKKDVSDIKRQEGSSPWSKRFISAAIIQGAIIVALTAFLVRSQISFLKPEISRVIAAGGAGTWFTFGYIIYIVVGVIGVAVSALFYYYIESIRKTIQYYQSCKSIGVGSPCSNECWYHSGNWYVDVCWICQWLFN